LIETDDLHLAAALGEKGMDQPVASITLASKITSVSRRIRFFNIKAGIYSTMESGPYASTEKEVITN
jgi:hypothetical protein